MLHSAASDLGLHCSPITLFGGHQTKMYIIPDKKLFFVHKKKKKKKKKEKEKIVDMLWILS